MCQSGVGAFGEKKLLVGMLKRKQMGEKKNEAVINPRVKK